MMRSKPNYHPSIRLLHGFVSALLALSFVPAVVPGQAASLFGTKSLEKRLQKRFRLTPDESRRLHPFIKRENENVVLLYNRYVDAESADYLSLWNGVLLSRQEFEHEFPRPLSPRQRAALREARTELEGRITNQWMDDYIGFLVQSLDLDTFQVDVIELILVKENAQRLRFVAKSFERPELDDAAWQRMTDERTAAFEKSLTAEQLRTYRSLIDPDDGLLARVPGRQKCLTCLGADERLQKPIVRRSS